MPPTTRALVLGALVLGFAPALAHACDDESAKAQSTASATATSSATSISSASASPSACVVKVQTDCRTKVTTVVTSQNKCSFRYDFKIENASEGTRGSGWSPGHLIEPDSMKLDPDQESVPGDAWVTISYLNGSIHSIQKAERRSLKKTRASAPKGSRGPTVQSSPSPY